MAETLFAGGEYQGYLDNVLRQFEQVSRDLEPEEPGNPSESPSPTMSAYLNFVNEIKETWRSIVLCNANIKNKTIALSEAYLDMRVALEKCLSYILQMSGFTNNLMLLLRWKKSALERCEPFNARNPLHLSQKLMDMRADLIERCLSALPQITLDNKEKVTYKAYMLLKDFLNTGLNVFEEHSKILTKLDREIIKSSPEIDREKNKQLIMCQFLTNYLAFLNSTYMSFQHYLSKYLKNAVPFDQPYKAYIDQQMTLPDHLQNLNSPSCRIPISQRGSINAEPPVEHDQIKNGSSCSLL